VTRRRFILIQFALFLVAGVAAILIAEQIMRWRYPELRYAAERQQRPETTFMQFDPRYGWSNMPGREVRFQRIDFDTKVTINADGFRGPTFGPRSPADTARTRIVVLGDSYVFGHGVEDDEILTVRLQSLLPAADVVNLGVTGYSTDQELLLLQDRGFDYDPDVVVLFACSNDLLDNGRETAWGLYQKPRFILDPTGALTLESPTVRDGVSWGMKLRREIRRHFVLYDLMAHRIEGLGGSLEVTDGSTVGASDLTQALIRRCAEVCHDRDVRFLLVVLPGWSDPMIFADLPPAGVGARLDLAEPFASRHEAQPDSTLAFEHDPHWNERGHRWVAELLAGELRRLDWLR